MYSSGGHILFKTESDLAISENVGSIIPISARLNPKTVLETEEKGIKEMLSSQSLY